jgi:hypothetical protein
MVPLNDFRVKGKADALLAAKVIAPTTTAHIRILVGFMIFVVWSIRRYTCFTATGQQLLSHSKRMRFPLIRDSCKQCRHIDSK